MQPYGALVYSRLQMKTSCLVQDNVYRLIIPSITSWTLSVVTKMEVLWYVFKTRPAGPHICIYMKASLFYF